MAENSTGNGMTAVVIILVALLVGFAIWAGYESMDDTAGVEIEASLPTDQ